MRIRVIASLLILVLGVESRRGTSMPPSKQSQIIPHQPYPYGWGLDKNVQDISEVKEVKRERYDKAILCYHAILSYVDLRILSVFRLR